MSAQELLKLLQLLGACLLLGNGLAWLALWSEPAVTTRLCLLAWLGALLCAGGALGELLRLALALTAGGGFGLAEALSIMALQTGVGRLLLARAALAVALAPCFTRLGRWLLPPLGLLLAFCFALGGHAAAEGAGALAVTADALHLLGAGLWFGGLVSLALLPWQALGQARLAQLLLRFSRLGVTVMLLLAATGLMLSARSLYGPIALVEQPYGQVLALKLAFFVGLLTVAAGSHWATRSLRSAGRLRLLRGLISVEGLLGVGLIGLAGVLTVTPTPRGEPYRVAITLSDTAFTPERVEVPAHRPVLLTLRNEGAHEHSFVVFGMPHEMISKGHQHGSGSMIAFVKPGERVQAQFVPRKAGVYAVYCMIEGHDEAPSPEVGSLVYLVVQ